MELQREVIVKGIELSIILDDFRDVVIGNNEYVGETEYDLGQDYIEDFDCDVLVYSDRARCHVGVSPKLKEIILDKLCDDDNFWDELDNKYFQSLEDAYIDSKIEEMRECGI